MANRDITIAELPATIVANDNSFIPIDNGDITYKIKVSDYNAGANATARAYAESASTSATNASTSAGNAATYADNASQSAQDASSSAASALEHKNNASLYANSAYEYAAAASTSASNATSQAQQVSDYAREATEKSEDAEAFAVGQRGGVDVDEEDIAHDNNAKYYAELAASNKRNSDTAASNSLASARIAEGFASGKQDGSAVPSSSEFYHNNAEYFSDLASGSANNAVAAANRAENAVVKSPYIGSNNHWYVYDFGRNEYVDTNVEAKGHKGDPGENYDDTEVKQEIADMQKIQDRTGIKNLLPFPYENLSGGYGGVLFDSQADGIVLVNGNGNYSHLSLFSNFANTKLKAGDYILSLELENYANLEGTLGFQVQFADRRTSPTTTTRTRIACTKTTPKAEAPFTITEDLINGINNGSVDFSLLLYSSSNGVTATDVKMLPMIRFANDNNDTWTPFAMSNVKLTLRTNEIEQHTDYVTPEMFGATGDGVVDDTAAFNAAVTAASTKGKKLYLPNRYYLSSKITLSALSSFVIEGQNAFNQGYDSNNEKSVIIAPNGFEIDSCVTIRNIKFKGYGVQIVGVRNNIEHCTFSECTKGIELICGTTSWHGEIIINNNFFDYCTTGIGFTIGNNNYVSYTDCVIRNNTFVRGDVGVSGTTHGTFIIGNHLYTAGINIDIYGDNNAILNNYIDQNGTLLNIGCRFGVTSVHNNMFYKSTIGKDENENPLPVCTFYGRAAAIISFNDNWINFTPSNPEPDLYFVKITGDTSLGVQYDDNICDFNFIDLGVGHLYASENSSHENLAKQIGEYLPTTASGTTYKNVAQAGATTVTFDASGFMSKYNAANTDLVFDVTAQTQNGGIVAYNSVSVDANGVVTIGCSALVEQTTFTCKCSVFM